MDRQSRACVVVAACAAVLGCDPAVGRAQVAPKPPVPTGPTALATLAGGCFWCMEGPFEALPGVRTVVSGYTGGPEVNPTYKQVASGRTGHTEAVQVDYNPEIVTFSELLDVYWRSMDPTDAGGQFADRGSQYRPGIFFHDEAQQKTAQESKAALGASEKFDKPVVVEITKLGAFYPAEDYHQDYHRKNEAHYKAYRKGSGREGFLTRVWGDQAARPPKKDTQGAAPGTYSKPADEQLKKRLSPLQYKVTQRDGTEPPFRNEFWDNKAAGIYVDVASGEPLFSSKDKYKSGTGWPSFVRPLVPANIVQEEDRKLLAVRTELRSKHGDSHLGHLFPDGPAPTGLRYCINSASLRFVPADKLDAEGYGEFAASLGK